MFLAKRDLEVASTGIRPAPHPDYDRKPERIAVDRPHQLGDCSDALAIAHSISAYQATRAFMVMYTPATIRTTATPVRRDCFCRETAANCAAIRRGSPKPAIARCCASRLSWDGSAATASHKWSSTSRRKRRASERSWRSAPKSESTYASITEASSAVRHPADRQSRRKTAARPRVAPRERPSRGGSTHRPSAVVTLSFEVGRVKATDIGFARRAAGPIWAAAGRPGR
jgi:hypothetical protein